MAASGQLPVDIETLVALSLVRLGTDTRGPRMFRETLAADIGAGHLGPRLLLERLAELTGLPKEGHGAGIADLERRARRAVARARELGHRIVSVLDAAYPLFLSEIPDPPIVLFAKGVWPLTDPAIAVVGSRRASPAGLAIARQLSHDLARLGLVVVSGLARGIDAAAHRGALDAKGRTIGVLGNGIDVGYPPEHCSLAAEVATEGAVLSEYPPGTRPFPSHFPLRNRIISGLCRAVVVVEASEKSGSLITARAALEQGRDVLAVPGNVASGHHRGCHGLIKDGARLVETVDDVLEEIGWAPAARPQETLGDKLNIVNDLWMVIRPGEALSLDELAARSHRAAPDLLAELTELELAGKVARTAGGAYMRLDGSGTYRGT